MNFSKITDYDIQALVDGELDHERSKHVYDEIQKNQAFNKRYKELLSQKKILVRWWEQIVN